MNNKTLGKIILASIAIAVLTAIFESSLGYSTAENLYMLSGIGMLVFGMWGAIRLMK